jgi:hypothetical protein
MNKFLILEKTGAELEAQGYSKCSKAKYDEYKSKSSEYSTAISDEGKYYYKKKQATQSDEEKKKKEEEKKKKEEEKKNKDEVLKNKYPSTGLTEEEGNKFRKWMKDNHSDFKDENGETLSEKGKPDNGTIRQAWDKYKTEYQKSSSTGTGSDTGSGTDSDKEEEGNADKERKNQEKEEKDKKQKKSSGTGVNCLEWDRNVNYFVKDFGEIDAHEKALEFEEWFKKKYRTFFDGRSIDFNVCKQDEVGNDIGISYYKVKEIYYLSPFIREISQMTDGSGEKMYDKWKFTLQESKIRKKLIEYKEMKTIKESVKQKLVLKLEDKNKKIDKISENLYKIAGDFYSGNYDSFYEKYSKLTESYKNSKMFLMEDSEQSFSNALVKVFKGDEDKFIGEAIPWFIGKLGLEGSIANQVESELTRKYGNETDMSGLFSDDWADVVVKAVKDNAKSSVGEPSNVMDAVEKVMISKLDTSDFDYQLKKIISSMIKPAQEEKKTKIQNLLSQIKKSILDQSSES